MAGLSASAMLTAWEAGARASPLDRGLRLLWAAGYRGDLADMPLTERDRALLDLRIATFGAETELLAECPACGTELELAVQLPEICSRIPAAETGGDAGRMLRPLTSRDLAAVAPLPEAEVPAALCARLADGQAPGDADLVALLEAREADRQIGFRMSCADCGAVWTDIWDIPAHLWAEVDAACARLMSEVAELARAFGWTEAETLALPPARRARYLALARTG